jgi:hypothetical protein
MPPARHSTAELIVVAVILGLFGVLIAVLVRAAKQRPAKLARLREAATVSAYSVSTSRVLVVLLLGTIIAAGSAPILMALSPGTPLLFLVSTGLAFTYRQGPAFVTLPLTELPPGWVRDDERFTLFGDEAAIIHERIRGE